ncbi:hypothetical protein SMACR_02711 [Sordaria macrospora]|uniref:MICOS complex subunit MIC12 n=2 Tax=Sordaria macrospora TaxID=5147 RepID=F7VX91_SORMK|nr:uncharacterized protein SMAC_02711 [Sordaria macrospora k-hell]KAA8636351.1 hypothetical protein SMACR_02711 [Sordaria macrospora]WPJ60459.1 hypothetical protein SMAC4_02711 [Sordaria macrospora]CCC10133.1 unnamed protein product [Sordaria macrospora k-hell]
MGFVAGLTGGATLTLGLTYLAIAAHERNRTHQSDLLRAQTRFVNTLARDTLPTNLRTRYPVNDEDLAYFPPPRSELVERERHRFVESAKDKWNNEIENAVRWAQTTDWSVVRESAEDAVAGLFGITIDRSEYAAEKAKEAARIAAERMRYAAEESKETGKIMAREAHVRSEEMRRRAAETARLWSQEAKEGIHAAEGVAHRIADEVRHDAEVVRGVVNSAVDKAVEKGRHGIEKVEEAVGLGKAAVRLAEDKLEAAADRKLLHVSDIDRALQERYTKSEDVMKKSVREVLAERYIPMDKRDNTRLRSLI